MHIFVNQKKAFSQDTCERKAHSAVNDMIFDYCEDRIFHLGC